VELKMQGYNFRMPTMKNNSLILLMCLILFSLKSYTAEPVPDRENKLSIGAGAAHNSMPYTAMDSTLQAVPLFDIQFGPLFAYNHHDEPVLGLELFRHKRVMFALAAIYGSQELDVSEADIDNSWIYYGIDDRDKATEVAILFEFYSKVGLVEILVARDVSNTYDDFRSSISWSRPFHETGNWTITPRMYGRYYSIKYNNYYYGITEEEMDAALIINQEIGSNGDFFTDNQYRSVRPAYEAGNGAHFGVDLSIDYHFTKNLKAQGYIGLEQLGGQVTSSIITEDADIWRLSLGLTYTL
jgi:outer membrane scaffolding protein for murein synthesis (MipA/OmpV family)